MTLGIGDVDAVFSALERALVDRDPALMYRSVEPQFESVRSDTRFPALLRRVGPPNAFFDTKIRDASFASDPH
jgi:hypothetical protein